jgi:Domain of unknown function (DUF4190)
VSQSDSPGAPDPWASVPGASTPPPYPAAAPAPPGPGYGPYPPPGPMPPYYQPVYQQRRTNGLAIAAMVCGICGFVYLVPAVLGIIFGIIALRQVNRDRNDGRGMAIAGIVTGSLWLIGFVVLIVAIITVGVDSGR